MKVYETRKAVVSKRSLREVLSEGLLPAKERLVWLAFRGVFKAARRLESSNRDFHCKLRLGSYLKKPSPMPSL